MPDPSLHNASVYGFVIGGLVCLILSPFMGIAAEWLAEKTLGDKSEDKQETDDDPGVPEP